GHDVNALDPPKPAVAPIAPLRRNHQSGDDVLALGRHDIKALALVGKHGRDTGSQSRGVKLLCLSFEGHCAVKIDQRIDIALPGQPYLHLTDLPPAINL